MKTDAQYLQRYTSPWASGGASTRRPQGIHHTCSPYLEGIVQVLPGVRSRDADARPCCLQRRCREAHHHQGNPPLPAQPRQRCYLPRIENHERLHGQAYTYTSPSWALFAWPQRWSITDTSSQNTGSHRSSTGPCRKMQQGLSHTGAAQGSKSLKLPEGHAQGGGKWGRTMTGEPQSPSTLQPMSRRRARK